MKVSRADVERAFSRPDGPDAPLRGRWARVSQTAPLRVYFEGEPDNVLEVTPDSLAGPVVAGDRVWTVRTDGGQLLVVGKLGGPAGGGGTVGVVEEYAGAALPAGDTHLWADGEPFSAAEYPELAAVLGTRYGGTVEFPRTPNRCGRVGVGRDADDPTFDTLGESGGEKAHTLTADEMPTHTHTQNAHGHSVANGTVPTPTHTHNLDTPNSGARFRIATGYTPIIALIKTLTSRNMTTAGNLADKATSSTGTSTAGVALEGDSAGPSATQSVTVGSTTATNQNAGGGDEHNNLQPYIVLNYIIRARG